MRIKIQFSLILFFLVNLCFSQVGIQNSVTVSSTSQVYDFSSKKLLSKKEIESRMTKPNNLIIPKEFDKLGNPINFYAISGLDTSGSLDFRPYYKHPKTGENFPPFIATTINNDKIYSNKLKGEILILNFQLILRAPIAKIDRIREVEDFVNSMDNMQSVIFSISGKDDAIQFMKEYNLTSGIIPNATDFTRKYGVFNFPTYMIINQEGNLAGIYSKTDELILALKEL
tara:strand:- start:27 stop:710 length:684 start_codon:yes stop_codon:yes gene_type:complete